MTFAFGARFVVALLAVAPYGTASATTRPWTLLDVLEAADDAVVFRVQSVRGERYAETAVGTVERSLKGTVDRGPLELPFSYRCRPIEGGIACEGCAQDIGFEPGKRYVALIRERTSDGGARATRYELLLGHERYHRVEISGPADLSLWLLERSLELLRTASVDRRATVVGEMLVHPSAEIRVEAVNALEGIEHDTTVPRLLRALNDPVPEVRLAAIAVLRRHPERSERITSALAHMVQSDADASVRTWATAALGPHASAAIIPTLIAIHDASSDESERRSLAHALIHSRHPDTLPFLIRLYDSEAWNGIAEVLYPFADMKDRRAAEYVMRLLETSGSNAVHVGEYLADPDAYRRRRVRRIAVQVLGALGFEEYFDRLVAWLPGSCAPEPPPSVLWTLARLGGSERSRPLLAFHARCVGADLDTYLQERMRELSREETVWALREGVLEQGEAFSPLATSETLGQRDP